GSQVSGGVLQFNNNTSDAGIGIAFNGARSQVVGFRPFQRWVHFAIRVPLGAVDTGDVELLIDGEKMDLVPVGATVALNTTANQAVFINPAGTAAIRVSNFAIYDAA